MLSIELTMSERSRPALNSMQGILEQIGALFRSVIIKITLIILINNCLRSKLIRLVLDIEGSKMREERHGLAQYWRDEDTKVIKRIEISPKKIFLDSEYTLRN
jgi:hypothetical protein